MPRVQAFPYLKAHAGRLQAGPWMEPDGDTVRLLDLWLPDRDPVVPFCAFRTVAIDQSGIRADCRLGPMDGLRVAVIWSSAGTGLRGHGSRINLDCGLATQTLDLHLDIDGALLADQVLIVTQLVLSAPGSGADPLAPRRPGSVLWQDEVMVSFSGDGARFPMEVIDFASQASWLPADAAWYLEWDPDDLDQPVLGQVRLLINSGHPVVAAAVAGSDERALTIQSAVRFDVGRTLIRGALESDDFVTRAAAYTDGSTGAAIRRLLTALFGDRSLVGLRQQCRQQPFRFDCHLQDRLRLFYDR